MSETNSHSGARSVLIWSLVTVVLVVALVWVVLQFVLAPRQAAGTSDGAGQTAVELSEIRRIEDSVLSTYELVDSTARTYRVPIERAIELVAAESARDSTR
jgi:hypothetical protein